MAPVHADRLLRGSVVGDGVEQVAAVALTVGRDVASCAVIERTPIRKRVQSDQGPEPVGGPGAVSACGVAAFRAGISHEARIAQKSASRYTRP